MIEINEQTTTKVKYPIIRYPDKLNNATNINYNNLLTINNNGV